MNKYQAIIFDMNGVIIDDEPIHLKADQETCEFFGLKVPAVEWPKIKGWKAGEIFTSFAKRFGKQPIEVEAMVDYKLKAYLRIVKGQLKPVAGVLDFIKLCRQLFPKLGLATSSFKRLQQLVFKNFSLAAYFDAIITAEDFERGKPAPDAYLKAAERLEADIHHCLVIEDSVNGVMAGKRAGATVLAITTSYSKAQLKKAGADYIFNNFQEAIKKQNLWS